MYHGGEENMNSGKRTGHQISTRRMDTNRYKRKNVTERNSDRTNKDRETDKQGRNMSS